ncbi:MAG TPA: protein-disulfide reductase DsbD domain-containing protein, partial [Tepidisphaeraceae bacterium]
MCRRILPFLLFLFLPCVAAAQVSPTISLAMDPPAPANGTAVLLVTVNVPRGYHAQSSTPSNEFLIPFVVTVEAPPGVSAAAPQYPAAKLKTYGIGERLSVYDGQFVIRVTLMLPAGAPPDPSAIKATVQYQICDDKGVCFAPETATVALGGVAPTTRTAALPAPPSDEIRSAAAAFGIALLTGLIFNVMPCVLPVLPLKAVGFFEAAGHDRGKSLLLGSAFALGMIAIFASLAVPVLVLKTLQWGELFSKDWFVWPMVALLLGMTAWLFGVLDFGLPPAVYRFAPRHDTLWGNFLWGGFTAVLATPCTAPLFPLLLLWAAQQPGLIAVASMATVGVGMALPYVILSALPEVARAMPRTGPWANLFKQTLAFGVLATAVYFAAGRLIAGNTFLWLVVATVGAGCVFLVVRAAQLSPNLRPRLVCGVIALLLLGGSVGVTR